MGTLTPSVYSLTLIASSLEEGAFGYGANSSQKLSPFTGKVAWRSHDERGITRSGRVPRGVPPQSVHYRSQTAPPQAVEPFGALYKLTD